MCTCIVYSLLAAVFFLDGVDEFKGMLVEVENTQLAVHVLTLDAT